MHATGASAGSVFVKRAGDARARFAEVAIFETDTVTRLAERASLKLDWRTSAAYVDLFLVPAESADALAVGDAELEALILAMRPLSSIKALSAVGIHNSSCLLARLSDPPAAPRGDNPAAAASHVGVEQGLPLTFERLLLEGNLRPSEIEAPALARARIKYGHLVTLAIMEHSPSLAVDAYELGKRLPSTATAQELRVAGYKMNGLLFEGSELVICYKGDRVHLLKGLREDEAARARSFQTALALTGGSVPHITTFDLVVSEGGKHLMIMPKFATALEPIPYLSAAGVVKMWAQLQEALERLHALGFAHADVKPGNICLSEDAESFYLIDLGSIAPFGHRTSSTAAYVPYDMSRGRSSIALDFWMLAMTLAEKACGPDHVLEVGGARHHTREEVRGHLAEHLDPEVWAALQPKLD